MTVRGEREGGGKEYRTEGKEARQGGEQGGRRSGGEGDRAGTTIK